MEKGGCILRTPPCRTGENSPVPLIFVVRTNPDHIVPNLRQVDLCHVELVAVIVVDGHDTLLGPGHPHLVRSRRKNKRQTENKTENDDNQHFECGRMLSLLHCFVLRTKEDCLCAGTATINNPSAYKYSTNRYQSQVNLEQQKTALSGDFLVYHSLFCSAHPLLSGVSHCFETIQ